MDPIGLALTLFLSLFPTPAVKTPAVDPAAAVVCLRDLPGVALAAKAMPCRRPVGVVHGQVQAG